MQVKILLTGGDGLIGKKLINNIQKSDLNVDLFFTKIKINHSFNVSKIFYCDLINDNLKESLFEYSSIILFTWHQLHMQKIRRKF